MHNHQRIFTVVATFALGAFIETANASDIIPVAQTRSVTADSIVGSPGQQDAEFISAPDFGEFNKVADSRIANSNALAQTTAAQHSTIDGCAVIATAETLAHGSTTAVGFHGYSIATTTCRVTFDITSQTEFLLAGSIDAAVHGQAQVFLQAFPSQLLFSRSIVGESLGIHHRVTLNPGQYIITYNAIATVAANDDASMDQTSTFDMQLTHCFIPADINVDGAVNVTDLLGVINSWGACAGEPQPCAADINLDGVVNVSDLLAVINAWGS